MRLRHAVVATDGIEWIAVEQIPVNKTLIRNCLLDDFLRRLDEGTKNGFPISENGGATNDRIVCR